MDTKLAKRSLKYPILAASMLFVRDPDSGDTAAKLDTLTKSCNRHSIDPFPYLQHVYTRLPMMSEAERHSLLPDNWIADPPQHLMDKRVQEAIDRALGTRFVYDDSGPGDGAVAKSCLNFAKSSSAFKQAIDCVYKCLPTMPPIAFTLSRTALWDLEQDTNDFFTQSSAISTNFRCLASDTCDVRSQHACLWPWSVLLRGLDAWGGVSRRPSGIH